MERRPAGCSPPLITATWWSVCEAFPWNITPSGRRSSRLISLPLSGLPLLDRDIRKLPPPAIKRAASSASRTPTSTGSVNGVTDSTTAVETARSDSATQEPENLPIRSFRKKRRRNRPPPPSSEEHHSRYWSEYDHPEDEESGEGYVIYVDPNQRSALDTMVDRLHGLFTWRRRRRLRSGEEQGLLAEPDTPKDSGTSEDEDENAPTTATQPHVRSYGSLPRPSRRRNTTTTPPTPTHRPRPAPEPHNPFLLPLLLLLLPPSNNHHKLHLLPHHPHRRLPPRRHRPPQTPLPSRPRRPLRRLQQPRLRHRRLRLPAPTAFRSSLVSGLGGRGPAFAGGLCGVWGAGGLDFGVGGSSAFRKTYCEDVGVRCVVLESGPGGERGSGEGTNLM